MSISLDYDIGEFSEFDEQCQNRERALIIVRSKVSEYRQGLESLGVVDAYIAAAIRAGVTAEEISAIWREFKND